MSPLLSRITLAILMLPLALVVFATIGVIIDASTPALPRSKEVFYASAGSVSFVVVFWVLLWSRYVSWTPWRIVLTLGLGLMNALIGGLGGFVAGWYVGEADGIFFGYCAGILLWLTSTVFIWRETKLERLEHRLGQGSIFCPQCKYNLSGLKHTTCPECGSEYTLEELFASQIVRESSIL